MNSINKINVFSREVKNALTNKYVRTYYYSRTVIGLNFYTDEDMENFKKGEDYAAIADYEAKSEYPRYLEFHFPPRY